MKPKRTRRERCPRCGSRNTGKYCYGYPSHELWEKAEQSDGALLLGGCCIGELNPTHFCHACRKDFGSYPLYALKSAGQEGSSCDTDPLSPDIGVRLFGMKNTFGDAIFGATKASFYVGGMPGECAYSFEMTPQSMELIAVDSYDTFKPGAEEANTRKRELDTTPEAFSELVKKLFLKLHVADWQKEYCDNNILDGTQWELCIDFENACEPLCLSGSNAYPPYYERLLNLLRPFFREQGLPFENA